MAGWPLQQRAGIEPVKPPSALLRLASPQPELALAAGFRLAAAFLVSAAEVAVPRPERAWLRPRVGVAHRAKALGPKERPARAPLAGWGAGQ
jgi:hypothetical protein